MWESRRDFQGVWEGWKASFLVFHAFHTLSFPWPALETRITKSQSLRRPVFGNRNHLSEFADDPTPEQTMRVLSGLALVHSSAPRTKKASSRAVGYRHVRAGPA